MKVLVGSGQAAIPRLCRDCSYFRLNPKIKGTDAINYGLCTYMAEINVVTGEPTYFHAQTMRMPSSECGPDAKFYVRAGTGPGEDEGADGSGP